MFFLKGSVRYPRFLLNANIRFTLFNCKNMLGKMPIKYEYCLA